MINLVNALNKSFNLANKTQVKKTLYGFTTLKGIHIKNIDKNYDSFYVVDETELKNEVGIINGYVYAEENKNVKEIIDNFIEIKYKLANVMISYTIIPDEGIKNFIIKKHYLNRNDLL